VRHESHLRDLKVKDHTFKSSLKCKIGKPVTMDPNQFVPIRLKVRVIFSNFFKLNISINLKGVNACHFDPKQEGR